MIKEVNGDILLTGAQAIAHGVAPSDHFDTGLALSLRKDYPAMVKDFRHFCKLKHPKPGEAWMWGTTGGKRIINLLTQQPAKSQSGHPGDATLSNVNHAVKELVKIIKKENIQSLALPRLATGYGNLDWEDVKPILYNRLKELDIPVYVYTLYKSGVKGKE